jgi:type II secretion system protein N
MRYYRKYIIIGCAIIWALLIVWAAAFLIFPYDKALKVVFEDFAGGSSTKLSFVNARKGFAYGAASKIIVGHESIEGKPFYELERVVLRWNPLSILAGVADMSVHASLYGGKIDFKVTDFPVIFGKIPKLSVDFSKVNLGTYPEDTVPWFQNMSGVMTGTIRKEVRLLAGEQEKGTFNFKITDGEIKEIPLEDGTELSLPFKEIALEGKIKGGKWEIEKILIVGKNVTMRGSGLVVDRGAERVLDIKLSYDASGQDKDSPLAGKGTIAVTGSVWSPGIVTAKEAGAKSIADFENSDFFKKYKARDKKSTPLKPTGTSFMYTYPDAEDKAGEIEVSLAPEPQSIGKIRVAWKGKPKKAPEFTGGRQQFFGDLLKFYDPTMETDEVISFVDAHQSDKNPGGEAALEQETIGKVLARAGIVGDALIAVIEKAK